MFKCYYLKILQVIIISYNQKQNCYLEYSTYTTHTAKCIIYVNRTHLYKFVMFIRIRRIIKTNKCASDETKAKSAYMHKSAHKTNAE